jgi:hypothetical protein
MMATKKSEAEKANVKEDVKTAEQELVNVMIPYVEGQDPEVTVGINGVYTKIKKGRPVKVPRNVAEVLAQSDQMTMVALETQEKFKSQREDW